MKQVLNKKIAFFSEMQWVGKVPRDHKNMRTEFSQFCALEAEHFPLLDMKKLAQNGIIFDYAILLIGKSPEFRQKLFNYETDIAFLARKIAKKVFFMQEGPVWIYQDLDVHLQAWHYNMLVSVDGILCENTTDKQYYRGIVKNPNSVNDIPSLMIEDSIKNIDTSIERKDVIVGGNFCQWYGGFDSYIVAMNFLNDGDQFNEHIWAPSMGRRKDGEQHYMRHLPYMNWLEWVEALNRFKYAVHLMPTFAAGTFAMNCAYLGIPCIGYNYVDTQRLCFPDLSVGTYDLRTASELTTGLKNDKGFYDSCSVKARQLYNENFSEEVFLKKMSKIFV